MKDYIVQTPLKKDGKLVPPQKIVSLEDAEAKPLLACHAIIDPDELVDVVNEAGEKEDENPNPGGNVVKITKRPENEDEARDAIVSAIESLDPIDKTQFTNDGAPDATVLTELLGWKVSAKDRDEIWAEVKKAKENK